jgi:hypothetical protein
LHIIGSRKTVPFHMFLIVLFGLLHIDFNPNSLSLPSSGVIVAHLLQHYTLSVASTLSTVTLSSVASRFGSPRSKYFKSNSKYGNISLSLIMCHITLAISSPSISTTGFSTLILSSALAAQTNRTALILLFQKIASLGNFLMYFQR